MHAPRSACFTFSGIVALCPILWAHGAEPALGLSSAQSHQTSRNLHQHEHGWETRDTGMTWSPKTDSQASLAIGALAFAPGNPAIIYAGTGEPNYGAQDDYYGAGLLKSTDGGTTWQLLGATNF